MNETPPFSLDSQRTMRGDAPAPARRLRAGDVLLNRYTVLSELGEGGMGVVYKCLDQVGGIEVAVKCLPPELSRNEGEMEGIRENYGIVAKLHHSAISGLRNLEKDPASGEYYLVMDLAEGEDLSAILRRRRGRPMPLEEALAILRPLASALDYAHGERVLHRDVKPANVKVRPAAEPGGAPRVQLLDFGLAAEVRSSMSRVSVRGHGGTSGTPAYMAPEQWEARRPDFRTDQYALAVVAYQMLAGFLPFDSEDTDLLRRAVLSRAPDPVEGLPPAANAALLRALAKAPKERFPTCAAFVMALEGRDGSTSRPPDGRAVGASLPETARGEGREESHAESAEPDSAGGSGTRRFLLVAAFVAAVGLFAFLAWPRHRSSANPVPVIVSPSGMEPDVAPSESISDFHHVVTRYGLVMVETNGTILVRGDFDTRAERLAATAELYEAQPGVMLDLADRETLLATSADLLAAVTDGAIKITDVSNRTAILAGYAPDPDFLASVLKSLRADVPRLTGVDASAVLLDPQISMPSVNASRDVRHLISTNAPAVMKTIGILMHPYPCLVLPSGIRLSVGAEIGGYKIVEISPDRIKFRRGEEEELILKTTLP